MTAPLTIGRHALVLGGLLVLCRTETSGLLQAALAAGVVLGSLDLLSATPRRYADYTPAGDDLGSLTMWILLAATVGLTLLLLPVELSAEDRDRRTLIVGLVLPVTALVIHWLFVRSATEEFYPGLTWQAFVAWMVTVSVVLGGALWLPRTTGLVLVVGLAVVAVDPLPVFVTDRWWIIFSILGAILGLVAGMRWPRPIAGIAMLGFAAGVGVVDESLAVLVLPAFAAFALASSLPTAGGVAAPALLSPLLLVVPYTAKVGWTSYTSSYGWTAHSPSQTMLNVANIAGIATIVICTAIGWVLTRRENTTIESA